MFKKLISTLFGKKENESHAPIDPTQLHRMLRIGVLDEDVIDPNSDEIEKALKQLEALRCEDNTYAILEVPNSEFNFIQTLFDEDSITLEFQKSDTEEQYSTTIKDTKKIIEVFRKYNEGNTSWKNNFNWKEVGY
jgi:hypothetical protein